MHYRERLKPPTPFYPPDEWRLIENEFQPAFIGQMESLMALGNGFLGMRATPEDEAPCVENGTYINGFYESWPIVYGESAYGLARTGQTMLNVIDSKIIRLYVDDEPFRLLSANLRHFRRQLNLKAGTLDREILWETPSGKHVLIKSRRLISFQHRHVAAISYEVTLLNAGAPLVISSEMKLQDSGRAEGEADPRLAKILSAQVLEHRAGYARNERIVLAHSTRQTGMIVACAIDHQLKSDHEYQYKTEYSENSGRVAFMIDAQPGQPIDLTKYMVYHVSRTAGADEITRRAEWNLDRVLPTGFPHLLAEQEQYLDDFWQKSDVRVSHVSVETAKLSTVEAQQAIRMNLFHILQASARAELNGVAAKGLTGQAYEGHYFWDTEIYVLPFLIYTRPRVARALLKFRHDMLDKARARARELALRGATFPWRTINGEEASAYYAAGTAQYHINADIVYALRKYVAASGDEPFLWNYGAEMLVETARLWRDLGFYSGAKGGRFCINAVTGPDEYNTVVNNNAFTNLMARENLRYAAKTVEVLAPRKPGG